MKTHCSFSVAMITLALSVLWPSHSFAEDSTSPSGEISTVWNQLSWGDYEGALKRLKQDLKPAENPDIAYAYLYCLYQTGQYDNLLWAMRSKAFSRVVAEPRGRILLGLVLCRKQNVFGAAMAWAPVVAAEPQNDLAWGCLRIAVLSIPRHHRTTLMKALLGMLKEQPFAQALFLGLTDMIRGESISAERHLLEAHEWFPESATVIWSLLDFYRHEGKTDEASRLEKTLAERGYNVYNINNINVISGMESNPTAALYRLPWSPGQTCYCPSHYSRRETPHKDRGRYALDFYLPQGTLVLAARAGVVHSVDDSPKVFGTQEFDTFIQIEHDDGSRARYFHIAGGTVGVKPGQKVEQGQPLGKVGRTGRSQSRHLHFEVVRKVSWRPRCPAIYSRWETVPVGFEETAHLALREIPGRWLTSINSAWMNLYQRK